MAWSVLIHAQAHPWHGNSVFPRAVTHLSEAVPWIDPEVAAGRKGYIPRPDDDDDLLTGWGFWRGGALTSATDWWVMVRMLFSLCASSPTMVSKMRGTMERTRLSSFSLSSHSSLFTASSFSRPAVTLILLMRALSLPTRALTRFESQYIDRLAQVV